MTLKKITSILLTITLLSQSILPVFAMDQIDKTDFSKKFGKLVYKTERLKQVTITKPHTDLSEEAMEERALVTAALRNYLSHHATAGVIVEPFDFILSTEKDIVATYELLKDEPNCSFSFLPLEMLQDEDRSSGEVNHKTSPLESATRHKLSKRVVGKKDKTAGGILHYALFEEAIHILLGQRNDNGGWCNLGGESEDGETPYQTASRESKEESNGIYAPHPDLLSHQPFVDTITEKNNSPFFYRMYFHNIQYLPPDVFKKKLLDTIIQGHNKEYTDFKWVKASDLWEAVATGKNILQIEGESIQLYGPLFHSLSTKSGESILYKLWLDKKLQTTSSDIYFSIQDSFNQCYQVGNTWNAEEFSQIQKEFYLPKSVDSTENNKILATAVAAHGMVMVQLKRKFQEIGSPTASKTAFWNPKCEKTLSQIHLAMVLGDQYKEPEDFKGASNPQRAANIENIKTYFSQNNDAEYWQKKSCDRKVSLIESDYKVLADILDWEEINKEWATFIHGASDSLNNLFKAFTYLKEIIGVRSLNHLVATRGTDIYFKGDKTIWDMINRTVDVENNETSNAMMFFNFVLFATRNTTCSTSSSIEYFANNHSVTPQDISGRFEEAIALCGFSKPDYSYFHSLFEQFYKYKHPTLENSVLIITSQNPETLDDYNYPTPGGGGFIITDYQHQKKKSTSQVVRTIQEELELQRQREQKLQWEFEHPLDHENMEEYHHFKPTAQASRVRFDSFNNDTMRKKSLIPENRRFLQPDTFLNLDFVRTRSFDRFPLGDEEEQTYDAEMRKTTVYIIADWLAEHTQSIPGSFIEIPVIKTIYTMAYEKIMGKKPEESLPIDGFKYLAQNSNKGAVEGFIVTCLDTFKSKNEEIPLSMAMNFLSALVKYGNIDLFDKIVKKYPTINLNDHFPNINYHGGYSSKMLPIFNMIDRDTPNFSEAIKLLIEKGVNTIEYIWNADLLYKITNELALYPYNLKGNLKSYFDMALDTIKIKAQNDFVMLMNEGFHNLISLLLGEIEELKVDSYLLPTGFTTLIDIVKNNKTLKRLTVGENKLLALSAGKLLAEGLKENATLETLTLPKQEMFDVMSTLTLYKAGAFRNTPWFKEAQAASYASHESLQMAITKNNWLHFTDLVKNSTIADLDLTKFYNLRFMPCDWMPALVEGLKGNSILCALTLPEDWQMQDIMVTLISSPQGPFTEAPWFKDAWRKLLQNPGEYLRTADLENDRHGAIVTILKNAPEEIELSKYIHSCRDWFKVLMQELSQDEPYLWLNLRGMFMSLDHVTMLAQALKTNTRLKSLNLTARYPDEQKEQCLAEGLKMNATLEKLSLSNEQMISVMGFLMENPNAPYRQAPWFALSWKGIIDSPEESIRVAFENAEWSNTKNQDLIQQIVCETNVEFLDLTKVGNNCQNWHARQWIKPTMEGLNINETISKLKVQVDDFRFGNKGKLTTVLQNNSHLTYLGLEVIEENYYKHLDDILCALKEIDSLALKVLDLSDCQHKIPDFCLESLKDLSRNKPNLKITVRFWI